MAGVHLNVVLTCVVETLVCNHSVESCTMLKHGTAGSSKVFKNMKDWDCIFC